MRVIIHGIAIAVAVLTLVMLAPSIRTGEISIRGGMASAVVALFVTYAVLIVAVGVFGKTPPAKWWLFAKRLFRDTERHDG
jgi:hypothetical protein